MLTAKQYNQNDVITFKLTSGEELLARINEERTNDYVLTKPMALLNTPNGGLGMMPVPISSDRNDPVILNKHAVAFHTKCEKDLASQYLEKTTGLKLATGLI
jgi:predicted esterase